MQIDGRREVKPRFCYRKKVVLHQMIICRGRRPRRPAANEFLCAKIIQPE